MKIKKFLIISILSLITLYIIFNIIIQALMIDVNKLHNFNNISDFEQYSHLQFIELYNFDQFMENNTKELLSNQNPIRIHYEDHEQNTYTVSYDESMSSYTFYFFVEDQKPIINEKENIKIDQSYLSYCFSQESDEYIFTVTSEDFKYVVNFKNNQKLSHTQLIEMIEAYVSNNNELQE